MKAVFAGCWVFFYFLFSWLPHVFSLAGSNKQPVRSAKKHGRHVCAAHCHWLPGLAAPISGMFFFSYLFFPAPDNRRLRRSVVIIFKHDKQRRLNSLSPLAAEPVATKLFRQHLEDFLDQFSAFLDEKIAKTSIPQASVKSGNQRFGASTSPSPRHIFSAKSGPDTRGVMQRCKHPRRRPP